MRNKGGLITAVEAASPAAGVGIAVGDRVWAINGQEMADLIDYQFMQADEYLVLELERPGDRPTSAGSARLSRRLDRLSRRAAAACPPS